ncbi:hypothetical protein FRC07_013809 [Ceratobasidium sp. 392]|nr:hypothetical protein FRC07_013809 [Ceratobasidium sp. 392]
MYRYIFHIDNTVPAHQQSDDIRLSLVCDWSRYLPPLPGITFSRQEHDLLLLRCFKYGTSWLLGLVPELFLHDMLYSLTSVASKDLSQPRLQHYSPLLHCSIMAFAAAFSDDPAIRAPATRARFASWAKQWLDDEFKYPVMSLVRALALLAEYHCGVGEKDAGYMFLGMSFRAVRLFDLKSDSDVTSFDDVITLSESNNPNWHFWSLFSYDKFMAIEHNIDYDIPIPNSGVVLPSVDDELDNQYWMPEPASTSSANTPSIKLTTITFHQSCKLMMIATRIIDVVRHQQKNLVEEHVVVDAHLRLDTWFNGLPEKLLIRARSASPLPYVIVLHMCYWWLLIALYQPFYQKEPLSGQEAQRMPIADLSIKICDRAAHKIVQLITMFEGYICLRDRVASGTYLDVHCGTQEAHQRRERHQHLRQRATYRLDHVAMRPSTRRRSSVALGTIEFFLDGIGGDPSDDVPPEQDMDDAEDISNMFHQYMHEWGHMPD